MCNLFPSYETYNNYVVCIPGKLFLWAQYTTTTRFKLSLITSTIPATCLTGQLCVLQVNSVSYRLVVCITGQ